MRLISTCMLYELAYCLLTVLILLLVLSDFIVSEWILNNKIRFGHLSGCIKVKPISLPSLIARNVDDINL